MAAKTLEVALKLNTGNLESGLDKSSAKVKGFGDQVDRTSKQTDGLGEKSEKSGLNVQKLGTMALVAGGLVVAGFGLAAKSAMDFDRAMAGVAIATGLSGKGLETLRQQALDAGATTQFSAGQAAEAQVLLSKAGLSAADIMRGGLTGALNLAAAADISLTDATAAATTALHVFGLSGKDMGEVADTLAEGARKSSSSVTDLGAGLHALGPMATQFGLTLHEAVGTLALFAQNGLTGAAAGGALRQTLTRLAAPTADAQGLMQSLGIQVFDSTGHMRDLADISGDLGGALGKMSPQMQDATLKTIFGARAMQGAVILFHQGADGVRAWTQAVSDTGVAAQEAARRNDNLAGDLHKLQGAFQEALINTGEKSQGALRTITQGATDLVFGLEAMSPAAQNAGLAIAGIGAGALLVVGGVIKLKSALIDLGVAEEAISVTPIGAALAAAAVVVGIFAKGLIDSGKAAQEAKTRVEAYVQSAGDVKEALRTQQFAASGVAKELDAAGTSWDDFGASVRSGATAFSLVTTNMTHDSVEFSDAVDMAANSSDAYARSLAEQYKAGKISSKTFLDGAIAAQQQAAAQAEATRQIQIENSIDPQSAEGKKKIAQAAQDATQQLTNMKTAIDDLIHGEFDEQTAMTGLHRELNQAAKDAKDFVDSGGKMKNVMTDTSDGALTLQDDLATLADKNATVIKSWIQQGVAGDDLNNRVNFLAQSMYAFAIAQGFPTDAAAHLRDTLLSIPSQVQSDVSVPGAAEATLTVGGLQARLDTLGGSKEFPFIQAQIDQRALSAADAALNEVARQRVAPILTFIGQLSAGSPAATGRAAGGIIDFNAAGRVYDALHIASIARPGTMRVWNEPEAGGEAYIPFANDWRRPRAMAVWRAAGQRLGVTPPRVQQVPSQSFAGALGGAGGGGPVVVNVNLPPVVAPNYVGDQTQLARGVAKALQSQIPEIRQAVTTAVQRASIK